MRFADKNGLAEAESFISTMTAAGGTNHMQALHLALRMGPDVIFFLTDADDPQFTAEELQDIRTKNGGVAINVVEFKSVPGDGSSSTLRELAAQNRGEYKNVEIGPTR
jgi:hypothetical protein